MYTHIEQITEILILAITSFISGLASLSLIYFIFKSFRHPFGNFLVFLILILSLLDFFMSFSAGSYRIVLIFVDPFSISQDPRAELFTWGALLWGFAHRASIIIPFFFCLIMYLEIEWGVRRDGFRIKFLFFALIFCITLIWACIPLCFEGYGINTNGTLTILNPLWNFCAFEIPLIIIILLIFGLTLRSLVIMRRNHLEEGASSFLYFPIIVLSSYFFGLVRTLFRVSNVEATWVYALVAIPISLQGIFNAIYCMAMTNTTKKSFLIIFGCSQPEAEETEHVEVYVSSSEEEQGNVEALIRGYEMPNIQGNL